MFKPSKTKIRLDLVFKSSPIFLCRESQDVSIFVLPCGLFGLFNQSRRNLGLISRRRNIFNRPIGKHVGILSDSVLRRLNIPRWNPEKKSRSHSYDALTFEEV